MDPIEVAIAAYESQELGEETSYRKIAAKYNVSRATLARRHKGSQSAKQANENQRQALNPQQERELVVYIEGLTKKGLPPTREMIQNFGSQVAHRELSESWVSRFISRNSIHLISKWSAGMDRVRHQADSGDKYTLYFQLLHGKMEEYHIQQQNTYNMDEKGFMIGVLGRTKRVFSKRMWVKKEVKASIQDGNREWITILACVCADGSALPPGIIYQGANGAVRDTWVNDITAGKHQVHVSSSPSGWTNNDIGLAWLEQVFDRYTKAKNPRAHRLLILDGHGSHLTMDFIEYCHQNKILLAIFPPHSTHTLQPLDVVLFKPLSSAYSSELARHQQQALGLLPITKGDFFPLFWAAWMTSFKKKTVLKSFEATGIWPKDAQVILERFIHTPPGSDGNQRSSSRLSPSDWREMDRLVRAAVKDTHRDEAKKLSLSLHQLSVQNQLLQHENRGLQQALNTKKKRKKHGKALDLQQREEYHGGAVFWSPRKVREARVRESVKEQEEEQEKLQKAELKELREANKLYKKKMAEEKRTEREMAKAAREKERAEKAAERAAKITARNTKKAIQTSQKGKRKASQAISPSNKRQKRVGGGAVAAEVQEEPSAPPPKVTSRGRSVNLPSKFR